MSNKAALKHFGPEPHYDAGPEAIHALIHKRAVDKTIARVYLGDSEPIRGLPDSEYLVFEFMDGSTLMLQVGAGLSFAVGSDKEATKVLARAKRA